MSSAAPRLQNKSIRARRFGAANRPRTNTNTRLLSSGTTTSGGSFTIKRLEDDDDTDVQNLDDSMNYDMVSVGGNSMAGMSDASGGSGSGVQVIGGQSEYDGSSMYSGSDV